MPYLRELLTRLDLRRPTVLASITTLTLAGLLGGGLLIAGATGSGPVTEVDATASPDAGTAADSSSTTSGGDDNAAVAVNTRDGSTVYALRLKVVITGADNVDSGNAAVAAASCSDCQTVAIALEGVIVTGDAETIAPENIALAINSGCSNCQTLAYAYQNLQTVDGKVRITGAGRAGIARLRQQLNQLRASGLSIEQVKAEVDRIAGDFAAILNSEVVPIGAGQRSATPTPTAGTPDPTASPATQETQTEPTQTSATPEPTEPSGTAEQSEPEPTS